MMRSKNGTDDEKPVHQVRIRKDFLLQRTPVTQRQWVAVMGTNPSSFEGKLEGKSDHPVETVSW